MYLPSRPSNEAGLDFRFHEKTANNVDVYFQAARPSPSTLISSIRRRSQFRIPSFGVPAL